MDFLTTFIFLFSGLEQELKSYNDILTVWVDSGATEEAAIELTLGQVEAFEKIVEDDKKWPVLLERFRQGRMYDSWIAADWPKGFDELVLCAPLCKLVEWECAKCCVGRKQNNFSCANDDSLFGYIAVVLSHEDRELIKEHIAKIKLLLKDGALYWDMAKHSVILRHPDIK